MGLNFDEYEPDNEVIDGIDNDNNDEIVVDVPIPFLYDVQHDVEVNFAPP